MLLAITLVLLVRVLTRTSIQVFAIIIALEELKMKTGSIAEDMMRGLARDAIKRGLTMAQFVKEQVGWEEMSNSQLEEWTKAYAWVRENAR
jgi:hypothetical protein